MRHLILICVFICPILLIGQNTSRGKMKLRAVPEQTVTVVDSTAATIANIRVSGYEKAQTSQTESMFITNNGDAPICAINLTVTYLNMNGLVLHRHNETIPCDLPAGETRSVSIKSWDKQRLWYYKGTQARHNDYCTPFDVSVKVNYVVKSLSN